ncbi:MAG: hypothetical protein ACXV5H_04860 [Halobacteriota archaeon]
MKIPKDTNVTGGGDAYRVACRNERRILQSARHLGVITLIFGLPCCPQLKETQRVRSELLAIREKLTDVYE